MSVYSPSQDFNGEFPLDPSAPDPARIIAGNIGSHDTNRAYALALEGKLPQSQLDEYGIDGLSLQAVQTALGITPDGLPDLPASPGVSTPVVAVAGAAVASPSAQISTVAQLVAKIPSWVWIVAAALLILHFIPVPKRGRVHVR